MNPNLAQTLDPKLKETYDRVMGTEVPTNVGASSPANEPQKHVPVEHIVTPQNPVTVPAQENSEPEMININAAPNTNASSQVSKGRKISPVIFVVVGVAIFSLYTVIWLKVFKIF